MRVAQSLSSAGLGLALLATFGFASQSRVPQQKLPKPEAATQVRPTEKFLVEPMKFAWSDMVKMQAELPPMAVAYPEAQPLPIDIEPQILPMPAGADNVTGGGPMLAPQSSDVQKALCPSIGMEPPLAANFVAQDDVPDSGLTMYIPPNPSGGAGPAHLMTMMSNQVQIRDRSGSSLSAVDLNVFWSVLTPSNVAYQRVSYDALSGRWVATGRTGTGGIMRIMFAISDTNDPTGTWDFYSFFADPAGTLTTGTFPDWIPHGINATWVTLIANMFNVVGGASAGAKMWVIDMSTALSGGPITISTFATGFLGAVTVGAVGNSFTPTTSLDTSSPDMWLLNTTFGAGGTPSPRCLQLVRISGTGAAPVASALPGSPFGGSTSLCFVTANFSTTLITVAQLTEPRFITPFSIRIMSAVLRNGKIWVSHMGGQPLAPAATNRTAGFWHQVDPTLPFPASPGAPGSMLLQGNVIDGVSTSSGIMFPSIAVNCGDDAVIGFTRSDSTRNPEASYVFRKGTDAAGVQSPIRLLKAGESTYWKNFGVGTLAQWGIQSSTVVDPLDDKNFWTLQEYAALRVGPADNDSRWGTRWGLIGCGTPTITDEPDALAVCVGDPASFSVTATAFNGPLTYQWRKDGFDILGETASTYSIAATVSGDFGIYDCVVTEPCGSTTSAGAALTFNGAVVTVQPQDQQGKKGGTATFTVAGTGTGTITYEWRHDGVSIVPPETGTSLVISPITSADFGTYDCLVSDDCGPTTSDSAQLSPKKLDGHLKPGSLDLAIFKQPESAVGCEGASLTLEITAFGHTGLVWRKDGFPIVPAETNDTLVLNPVDALSAGSYDVVVSGPGGPIVSDAAVVTVNVAPTVTLNPTNQSKPIGGTATFTCAGTGDGTLTYQWQKAPLMGGAFVDIAGADEDTLVISPVVPASAARYRCVISNHCGSTATANAKLNISL